MEGVDKSLGLRKVSARVPTQRSTSGRAYLVIATYANDTLNSPPRLLLKVNYRPRGGHMAHYVSRWHYVSLRIKHGWYHLCVMGYAVWHLIRAGSCCVFLLGQLACVWFFHHTSTHVLFCVTHNIISQYVYTSQITHTNYLFHLLMVVSKHSHS